MTKSKLTSKREQSGLRKALLTVIAFFMAIPLFAQNVNVSGTVVDETGEPLIGVTVMVAGTSNGTATDLDGNYELKNVPSKGKLVFSYIGYADKTENVNGRTKIDITMTEDSQSLDELVVVGYGVMRKSDLTGSVSTVGTEKLNAKGAVSVLENLQGTVAGVNVTKSTGRANGEINVEIRGKSSINSDTKPMYVVDGVITDNIDFLNSQDIERIDVLKDASSTAIYGSRATAGVIMVTTKGALGMKKEQAPSISYDGYVGISKAARMPNLMSANEFYDYRFYKFGQSINSIAGNSPLLTPQTIYGYVPSGGGLGQCLLQQNQSDITSPYILKELLNEGKTYNWPDLVLRDGIQQNHYVSVSGGSKHTTYNFGIGINNDKGFYKGDESTTYNFKGSMDVRVNKVISAGFNLNAALKENSYANDDAISHIWYMNPFMIPYTEDGEIVHYPGYSGTYGTDGNEFSKAVSPLDLLRNASHERKTYRLLGNVYLKLDLIKGLNFKSTFSPSYSYYRDGQFTGYANPNEPGKTYGGADLETAKATVTNHSNMNWIWDNVLTYSNTIAEDHSINAMGLISAEKGQSENYKWVVANVLENTDWWNMGSGETDNKNSSSSFGQSTMMSYALRLNYGFKNRYLITATMRWDGSSKLAAGHRWHSFPSVAAAWTLTEESFMERATNVLNNLKLRVSYGITGNNTGVKQYQSLVGIDGPMYYPFYGLGYQNGYFAGGIVDKSLTWETSKEFNVGLDFGFLKNRITGTIDWYVKNSDKLLFDVDLPLEAGGVKMKTNIGKVRNTGIELSLSSVNIETHDWNWTTTLTLAHNSNKVKEINGVSDRYVGGATSSLFIGSPVNNVYAYEWTGIVTDKNMTVPNHQVAIDHGFTPGATVRECDYYYECYGLSEGRAIIKDVNGDGVYGQDDKVIFNSDPNFTGSFTSNLSYRLPRKGGMIDFSFSLYARQGGKVYAPFMNGDLFKTSDRGWQKVMVDYYVPQGALVNCDGINADGTYINPVYQTQTHYGSWPFPNATEADGVGSTNSPANNWNEAKQVVDASFLKVKNISLGYTFDKDILKHIGCKEARVYVNVTNPFVFTNYLGFDPEWAGASVKNDGPSTINYQVGLSIKF